MKHAVMIFVMLAACNDLTDAAPDAETDAAPDAGIDPVCIHYCITADQCDEIGGTIVGGYTCPDFNPDWICCRDPNYPDGGE